MWVQIIKKNTEETLLRCVDATNNEFVSMSFLSCALSKSNLSTNDIDILLIGIKETLRDHKAIIYCCQDKDLFIEWSGSTKGVMKVITDNIMLYCRQKDPAWNIDGFFYYYDVNAHKLQLHKIFTEKLVAINNYKIQVQKNVMQTLEAEKYAVRFTPEQIAIFDYALISRAKRSAPEILIVEDQLFSRKLLHSLLHTKYSCHMAKNAKEALSVFASVAPDIMLLDIELPETTGHEIAKFIRTIDQKICIIMVTANNYESDVMAAKKNNVQGFIIKPYNKQRILDLVAKCYIIMKQ